MSTSGSNDFSGFAGEYWSRNVISTTELVGKSDQPLAWIVLPAQLGHCWSHVSEVWFHRRLMVVVQGHPTSRQPMRVVELPDTGI